MRTISIFLASASVLALAACETVSDAPEVEAEAVADDVVEAVEVDIEVEVEQTVSETVDMPTNAERLQAILDAQPEDVQARYGARNPAETLAFFGVEPGMVVVEALPGGGWYSKILMPYLGSEGALVGAQYPDEIWAKILPPGNEDRIQGFIDRSAGWKDTALEWVGDDGPEVHSYQMTKLGRENTEDADAFLFIRALHNLNRTEESDGYLSKTVAEAYRALRPGGLVGVVQHRAPEENSDEWASGGNGYLKQSYVISVFEEAGFVLADTSEINANSADQPTEDDFVWRLPPTRAGAETEEARAIVDAIGESDRMTLKFLKPYPTYDADPDDADYEK